MGKIKLKTGGTIAEHFEAFLLAKQADGLSGKTLTTYRQHFGAVSKHLASDTELDALQKKDLDNMIVQMRGSGLSSNATTTLGKQITSGYGARSKTLFTQSVPRRRRYSRLSAKFPI